MEENVITGIVIAGNIYNIMPSGVKCQIGRAHV